MGKEMKKPDVSIRLFGIVRGQHTGRVDNKAID